MARSFGTLLAVATLAAGGSLACGDSPMGTRAPSPHVRRSIEVTLDERRDAAHGAVLSFAMHGGWVPWNLTRGYDTLTFWSAELPPHPGKTPVVRLVLDGRGFGGWFPADARHGDGRLLGQHHRHARPPGRARAREPGRLDVDRTGAVRGRAWHVRPLLRPRRPQPGKGALRRPAA